MVAEVVIFNTLMGNSKTTKAPNSLEAFERIGKFAELDIKFGGSVNPTGYRTTIRCSVQEGKAGMRAFRSHNHIPLSSCGIAHRRVEEIMTASYFGENEEVVIRTSALTGKALAVVSTSLRELRPLMMFKSSVTKNYRKEKRHTLLNEFTVTTGEFQRSRFFKHLLKVVNCWCGLWTES